MQLLVGPPELRYIQNVALMMFCEYQEKFFMYSHIQMTLFPEGSVNNPSLSEDFPVIKGSVPQMIEATLERFKTLILREKVIKVRGQAEAIRIWNYPYQAIEEAVVNAFYHRDYLSYEPGTIEILKKLYPIIEHIEEMQEILVREAMELTSKSRTTVWRYLKILVDAGVVESEGGTNNLIYRLTKNYQK